MLTKTQMVNWKQGCIKDTGGGCPHETRTEEQNSETNRDGGY